MADNNTITAMMTEEEFLAHVGITEDMTEEDVLMHYGKKGMKWGQKAAGYALGDYAKARTSTGNSKTRADGRGERDSAIGSARTRAYGGGNKANLKAAKAANRAAKHTAGAAAAKQALRAVRDKNADDKHDAALIKSGGERVAAVLVGSESVQLYNWFKNR